MSQGISNFDSIFSAWLQPIAYLLFLQPRVSHLKTIKYSSRKKNSQGIDIFSTEANTHHCSAQTQYQKKIQRNWIYQGKQGRFSFKQSQGKQGPSPRRLQPCIYEAPNVLSSRSASHLFWNPQWCCHFCFSIARHRKGAFANVCIDRCYSHSARKIFTWALVIHEGASTTNI